MNPNSSDRPIRLRDRLREATSEAILDAAEQTFAVEGPKARMESIASRAGIAVGTLYNHFADRDALWSELCRSRREALLVRLDAALAATRSAGFEEALRAFLGAFLVHWSKHRGFLAILIQAEPVGGRSPRSGASGRTMGAELLDRARALVARGVEEGALRRDGAELHPVLLLGMLRGVLLHQLDPASPPAGDAELERVVDVFLHGTATGSAGVRSIRGGRRR